MYGQHKKIPYAGVAAPELCGHCKKVLYGRKY